MPCSNTYGKSGFNANGWQGDTYGQPYWSDGARIQPGEDSYHKRMGPDVFGSDQSSQRESDIYVRPGGDTYHRREFDDTFGSNW